VETVWRVLTSKAHKHNGFPIVAMPYGEDGTDSGDHSAAKPVFVGIILRSQLITLLRKRAFKESPVPNPEDPLGITLEDFIALYPRLPSIESVTLADEDRSLYIDMTPYMNPDPYVIRQKATLTRVYTLFRTMGLRHLVVVNKHNNVVGMITRKDMVNLDEKLVNRNISLRSGRVITTTQAYTETAGFPAFMDSPVNASGDFSVNTI